MSAPSQGLRTKVMRWIHLPFFLFPVRRRARPWEEYRQVEMFWSPVPWPVWALWLTLVNGIRRTEFVEWGSSRFSGHERETILVDRMGLEDGLASYMAEDWLEQAGNKWVARTFGCHFLKEKPDPKPGLLARALHLFASVLVVVVGVYLTSYIAWRLSSPLRGIQTVKQAVAVTTPGKRDTLRIGCYNIAHGRGGEAGQSNWSGGSKEVRTKRLSAIATLIRDQNLDVVVLNEVDTGCTWSHGVDQVDELARQARYAHALKQRNLDLWVPFFSVRIGNAIVSRHPVTAAKKIDLPAVRDWEPWLIGEKDAARATIDWQGTPVDVMAVHLETRGRQIRKDSVAKLLDAVGERPCILAGDFNAQKGPPPAFIGEPGNGVQVHRPTAIDMMLEDGRWQAAPTGPTFPTTKPSRRIDWIFVPATWEHVSSEVIDSPLSDHALVVSEWRP